MADVKMKEVMPDAVYVEWSRDERCPHTVNRISWRNASCAWEGGGG